MNKYFRISVEKNSNAKYLDYVNGLLPLSRMWLWMLHIMIIFQMLLLDGLCMANSIFTLSTSLHQKENSLQ